MKRKLMTLGVLTLVLLMAIGCMSNKVDDVAEKEANASVGEIVEKIQNDIEWPTLIDLDDKMLSEIYGIDVNSLEEYAIKIPMMNVKANEIAVIRVKDVANIEKVKKNVEKRAENVKKIFETYLPDQYEIADNYLLEVKGKYIVFAIHGETDKVQEIFNSFFQ